jgi:lipoate-protein ligase A
MATSTKHAHVDYKAPNGKLIRIDATLQDGVIESILIHGDFFIYPEESIVEIEKCLIGARADDVLEVRKKLDSLILEKKIELVGLTTADLAEALRKASEKK